VTSKFKIGEIDLGSTTLETVPINPTLLDIDGYLGIDFLNKAIFFLDFQKSKALIYPMRVSGK
jgi:hypothetical protein